MNAFAAKLTILPSCSLESDLYKQQYSRPPDLYTALHKQLPVIIHTALADYQVDAALTPFLRPHEHQTTMASTALTPLATMAAITSPFLRLAPELRNRIYKYTFTDIKKPGFVPHALTQTNQEIRNECRAVYYASIECIEITLHTTAQYDLTKK